MKRFLYLLILLAFLACDTGTGTAPVETPEDPPVNVVPDTPPPADPPIDEEIELGGIILALYDGSTLRLWDGNILSDAYTGHVVDAGDKRLAFDDVLYYFDEAGESVHSQWLPVVPDHLVVTESSSVSGGVSRAVVYEDDVITLENIPADEAYALGARYEDYTRILENGIEVGAWYLNEWKVTEVMETASGHILVRDETKNWHNLTDSKAVSNAYPGGIMTYAMGTQTGYIADASGEYHVTWSMNYFDNSRWLQADGVWYTENGYSWTPETGVLSDINKMYGWNNWATYPDTYGAAYGEVPYLLPAGVHAENGEECTYWIECNTGQLYRHIPSIDRLDLITELYDGPDTRVGGIPYFNTLDPQVIEDKLYFHEGGSIKTYDFTTGLVSIFSSDQEVIEW